MFEPSHYVEIPNVDICTWAFGKTDHDLDKPIYIDAEDPSKYLTYNTALSHVRRLVAGLRAIGVKPGDSVCLHAYNNVFYAALFFATVGAGGAFVGSNPAYTPYEMEHLFKVTETKFVVVDPGLLDKVLLSSRACGIPDSRVLLFDPEGDQVPAGFESWTTLLQHGEQDWTRFDDEQQQASTPAGLSLTSGTTGLPKAAVLSHRHFVAMNVMSHDSAAKQYEVVRLYSIPQFHAFAIPQTHMPPLRDGFATYLMKRFQLGRYVGHLARYGVTETAVVTPVVLALLALAPEQQQALRTLRFVLGGGAPLGAAKQNALRDLCHADARFGQVWGLTETAWVTMMKFPERDDDGSCGRLLPNTQARIVDDRGADVADEDCRGEVLVRSPALMGGYLNNPEATAATVAGGWLRTGDVGYTRGGKWFIVDRKKDLIKVRAWQVSPAELEQCLVQHPAIHDAGVIGLDFGDDRGELPRAYISLEAGAHDPGDADILAFMAERLASYKALAGGIVRLPEMPRNKSGKVVKPVLRQMAKDEMLKHQSTQMTNGT